MEVKTYQHQLAQIGLCTHTTSKHDRKGRNTKAKIKKDKTMALTFSSERDIDNIKHKSDINF